MYSQPSGFIPLLAMALATEIISAALQMSWFGSGCGSNDWAQSPYVHHVFQPIGGRRETPLL